LKSKTLTPCLKPNHFLISGADADAVYDIEGKKVFRINHIAYEILRLCNGKRSTKDISNDIALRSGYAKMVVHADLMEFLENEGSELVSLISSHERSDLEFIPKESRNAKLKRVLWECTNACNLRCVHCLVDAGKSMMKEISTKEAKRLIHIFADLGVEEMTFSGGEPFCRSDFIELIHFTKDCGIGVNVLTNGTLNQSGVDNLLKIASDIQLTLLGSKPEIHDALTGIKGSYKKTLTTMKQLGKAGVASFDVSFVTMRLNFFDIAATRQLVQKLGGKLRIGMLLPIGRAEKNKHEIGLTKDQLKLHKRFSAEVSSEEYSQMDSLLKGVLSFREFRKIPCPSSSFAVTCLGDIILCPGIRQHKLGNVIGKTPEEIENQYSLVQEFRSTLSVDNIPKCLSCELRYSCMGGCRAITHAYSNTLKAKSPFCEIYL